MSHALIDRRSLILTAAAGLATPAFAADAYDAVVVGREDRRRFAAPRFATLSAAIAYAPAEGRRPFRILVTRGTWREKLTITRPFVHLIGEGPDQSRILFHAASGETAPDGEPWGTFRTATVTVLAPNFAARNLTIENSFDDPAEPAAPALALSTDKALGRQAVALMLDRDADRSWLRNVRLLSYQDTLFPNAGVSLFEDCYVAGTVDFIFGAGVALFERCEIRSRQWAARTDGGYITAPSTLTSQRYGLVFSRCHLTKDLALAPASTFLGRPWRPTTTFPDGRYGNPEAVGASTFLDCWMDDHIAPAGWTEMTYNARGGGRAALQPEQARFAEYGSTGPGAGPHPRGRTLSAAEAADYGRARVLGGWSPDATELRTSWSVRRRR